jgi:glycosyltransferase involved in cell wall biosynthesis
MKLSIIIPCFNEEKTIAKIVDKIAMFKTLEKEIIIVDDCSNDRSREIIEEISKTQVICSKS